MYKIKYTKKEEFLQTLALINKKLLTEIELSVIFSCQCLNLQAISEIIENENGESES